MNILFIFIDIFSNDTSINNKYLQRKKREHNQQNN